MRYSTTKIRPAVSKSTAPASGFREALLAWYDSHGRDLPWRLKGGARPDPYRVWLSEIMLQQTTVAAVKAYFEKFLARWPTVSSLASAPEEHVLAAWAGLGYYARARNLHRCAQKVAQEFHGRFPETEDGLRALPGVGDYTAAAIAAIAFNRPATVVDANVDRVVARWFGVAVPLPEAKKDIRHFAASLSAGSTDRPGDFAQAMMDLGAMICTPRAPACALCPVSRGCNAFQTGRQDELPKRAIKKLKPVRFGEIYWLTDGRGRVLLEKRPARGLLGGMTGLPTSEWMTGENNPPLADWLGKTVLSGTPHIIHHTFTHFDLRLRIQCAGLRGFRPREYQRWIAPEDICNAGLPTVFLKCAKAMLT